MADLEPENNGQENRKDHPRYRKLGANFFTDEKIFALTYTEKLIAVYLLTGQVNRIGFYPFSVAKAQEDLKLTRKTFQASFERVLELLGWRYDPNSRVIFIPTWWKFNNPGSFKVLIGALRDLDDVPKTELFNDFATNLRYLPPNLHQNFKEGICIRMPIQYQHQQQHQHQEQQTESCEVATPPASYLRSRLTWEAYEAEYLTVYGVKPIRNATVNSQLAAFIKRVPLEDAPAIAAFYVYHKDQFYVQKRHPIGLLLKDAEGLYTQWKSKHSVTHAQAKQIDKTAGLLNTMAELKEELYGKEAHDEHDAGVDWEGVIEVQGEVVNS